MISGGRGEDPTADEPPYREGAAAAGVRMVAGVGHGRAVISRAGLASIYRPCRAMRNMLCMAKTAPGGAGRTLRCHGARA